MFTKETIEHYFLNFKHVHLFLCLVSIAAIIIAAIFYLVIKKDFYKGIAIALVSFAFAYGTYGYFNYNKSDRLRKINIYNYDLHPEYLKAKELPRINKLKKNNTIILIVNFILLATSIYFGTYYSKNIKLLSGLFYGIFLMNIIAIAVCFTILYSTKMYEKGIINITSKIFIKENVVPL